MRRALGEGLECLGGRRSGLSHWLGPGNTNKRVAEACWVGTRCSTLPVPILLYTTPVPTLPPHPARSTRYEEGAPRTGVLRRSKEILGVDNAQYPWGRSQYPRTAHCAALLIAPLQRAS